MAPGARAVTAAEAVGSSDVVVLSVPMRRYLTLDPGLLAGRVVVDAMNYWPETDGHLPAMEGDLSTSEVVQDHLAGARLVKTLNHIGYHELESDHAPAGSPGRRALAVAGDDGEARTLVGEVVDRLGTTSSTPDPSPPAGRWSPARRSSPAGTTPRLCACCCPSLRSPPGPRVPRRPRHPGAGTDSCSLPPAEVFWAGGRGPTVLCVLQGLRPRAGGGTSEFAMDRSHLFLPALAVALSLGAAVPATAHDPGTPEVHDHRSLPDRIELPRGFQPEGIATARHDGTAWVGSLADGDILRLDLRTGGRKLLSEGPGTPSVGMTLDRHGRLFVAGGPSGEGRVVSTRTGKVLATYRLARGSTFINDVTILDGVAWFTDSSNAVLHGVPLGRHGRLPRQDEVVHLKLRGAWRQVAGFNANGIASTPDGEALLVAHSALGTVFRVDPETGNARKVNLPAVRTSVRGAKGPVAFADGLLREGRTLYVVQNTANQVAVLRLDEEGERARLEDVLRSKNFDTPTTAAIYRDSLYLPSARFGTPQPTRAAYWVTRVDR